MAGDGMMAGFGVNKEHASGAHEALAAGHAMLQAFVPIAARWRSELSIDAGIGIGMHFVEVAVGALGPARHKRTTLVGDTVDQAGVVEATTSITRPASIVITATDTTTFGADSVTAILPEDNGETIVANSLSSYTAPSISISTINLDMASGSLIEAPGATMTVSF